MNRIFFFLLIAAVVPCVFAVPLEDIVPGQAQKLRSGGDLIIETQLINPSPKLLPLDGELKRFFDRVMGALNPNLMAEALYLYKKPDDSHTDLNDWDNRQKTELFNHMLAISTLTGIQYYSASRKTIRTFYELSQVIDGPNTKHPISDPVFDVLPAEIFLYARQKDLTFGDNIYRYDYVVSKNCIFFIQENITALNVSLIPAIRKGNLMSIMAVFDCGDSLLIYAVSMAKTVSMPGMGDRIGASFSNRVEAILKWYTGRVDLAF